MARYLPEVPPSPFKGPLLPADSESETGDSLPGRFPAKFITIGNPMSDIIIIMSGGMKWAVVVAVPKEVRELSVAEESEREETRMARRGPLFEDQNFQAVREH